jgi:hypothetical protein
MNSFTQDDTHSPDIISKNKIKSQTNWLFNYNGDKLQQTGKKTSLIRYNHKGRIESSITYNAINGEISTRETYKYDRYNHRIEYIRYSGESSNASYEKYASYNSHGDILKEWGFDGSSKFENKFSYSSPGKLKTIEYMVNNQLTEKRKFTHNGHITNVQIYNVSNTLISKLKLTYDSKGNLTEELTLSANGDILDKKKMVYNSSSRLISEARYKGNKLISQTIYTYDTKGNLLSIVEDNPNIGKFEKKKFTYDTNSNLKQLLWRRRPSEKFNEKSYNYNQQGLCTDEITYYPGTKYKALTKYTYDFF